MPTLEGDAKTTNKLAHNRDPLRCYEDPEDLGHSGKIISRRAFNEINSATGANSLKGRFSHKPMHDAESAFWVIVAFLLWACPIDNTKDAGNREERDSLPSPVVEDEQHRKNEERGSSNEVIGDEDEDGDGDFDGDGDEDGDSDFNEDENRNGNGDGGKDDGDGRNRKGDEEGLDAADHKLDDVWRLLAEHSIQDNGIDSRDTMFQFNIARWQDVLHPKLSFLTPMLGLLCEQVQPEYSLVTPTPHELHLHEAIQCILLMYIWDMKNLDHVLLDQKL
jgi:hypothetical protein